MAFGKKKKDSQEESYYSDYNEEPKTQKIPLLPRNVVIITAVALVMIIVLVLALGLLGEKNNLIFFGPDGNALGSKVTISKDGKLISSLTTNGGVLHLSGNPSEPKKITIKTSGITLVGKNVSIQIKTPGGIIIRDLSRADYYIDANGNIALTINPLEDLNISGYYDANTGEFVYTDTNIDITISIIIADPNTGETTIIDLQGVFTPSEFNQNGCIALSRTAYAESTHFGFLDSSFKIQTSCDSSADLVSNVVWRSQRMGNVEVVFGNFSSDTILFSSDQPVLTAPAPNIYNVRVIFTPFKEFAGQKADFAVNFGLGDTASSQSSVDYQVALDNLEQCVRVTPNKVEIPANADSSTFNIDVSSCASQSVSISLCDGDPTCSAGTEGGIGLDQLAFSLSPKSNPSKTITITRADIPGAYGIPINARISGYSKTFINEEPVTVQPKGDELLTPDKFVISLMGGAKDSIQVRNKSLAEDVSVDASICQVHDSSLGVQSSGDNYGVIGQSAFGKNSWWQDLYSNQKKYAGDGKYQASIVNTLASLDYIRSATQLVSANKNADIKKAYLDIVAEDDHATITLAKAKKSYDDMKTLVAKADEWNKYKAEDIAMNYTSLAANVASLVTESVAAETATISAATACSAASTSADALAATGAGCSGAATTATASATAANAAMVASDLAAAVASAQLVQQSYSIEQQVQALANPPKDIDYSAALSKAKVYYDNMVAIKDHTSKAREYASQALSAAAIDSFSKVSQDDADAGKYLEQAKEQNDFVVGTMLDTQTSELGALTEITSLMQEAQSSLDQITGYVSAALSMVTMIGKTITGHTLVEGKLTAALTSVQTSSASATSSIVIATPLLICPGPCQLGCTATIVAAGTTITTCQTASTTISTGIGTLGGLNGAISTASSIISVVQMGYQTWRGLSMDFIQDLQNAQVSGQAAVDETYPFMTDASTAQDSVTKGIASANWLATNSKDASIAAGYDDSIFTLQGEFNKKRMSGLVGDAIANGFVNGAYEGGVYTTKQTDYTPSASPLRTQQAPQENTNENTSLSNLSASSTSNSNATLENNTLNAINSHASFDATASYDLKENCANRVTMTMPDYSINLINDAQRIGLSNNSVTASWDFSNAKVFDVFNQQEASVIFASTGLKSNSYGVVEISANKHEHANPTIITGKFGPFDIPDASVAPVTYKYHFKFNVAPRIGSSFVSLAQSDCTNGLMRGVTSASNLPKTLMSWDWNSVSGLLAKTNSKQSSSTSALIGNGGANEPFIDATQLSILLSKKLGSLSSLLTESSLECPENPAKVILTQIRPTFTAEDGISDPNALNVDPNAFCYLPYTTKEYDGLPALYYFLQNADLTSQKDWKSDSEVVSTADQFLSLVDFNANLMRDGYGIDFQSDYSVSYGSKILLAGPSFLDSRSGAKLYFSDSDRSYFSSPANYDKSATKWALPDAGTYKVRMYIDFLDYPLLYRGGTPGAKIVFDLYSLDPIYSNYGPLYYTPLDGFTGLNANNNRRYYGSGLTNGISSVDVTPTQGAVLSNLQNQALVMPQLQKISNVGILSSSPYLRSRLLDYSYNFNTKTFSDSTSQLVFSPTIATPLLFELNGEVGKTTQFNYSLSMDNKAYLPKSNSLLLFSYVGDCSDLASSKLSNYVNFTPDLSIGNGFGASLPTATTSGKTFIKTIAYVPVGDLFGLYKPLNASVYSPNDFSGTTDPVILGGINGMRANDEAGNQASDSFSNIFNGVSSGSICVSHQGTRDVFYWPDNVLFKTKGSASTSLQDRINQASVACTK